MRDTEREAETWAEGEAACQELNVGLDPGSPGSHPGPKAAPTPNYWATGAARVCGFLKDFFFSFKAPPPPPKKLKLLPVKV